MKYKGDIGLYLSGAPIPLPECALYLTQPTIKQVVQFGETNFLMAVQLLGQTDNYFKEIKEGNPELAQKTDFQILMVLINEDKNVQKYLDTFFELTFPDYDVIYDKNSINFSLKASEKQQISGMITMYSFECFQTAVKELFVIQSDQREDYNPANEAAARIAEKLKKARKILGEQKDSGEDNVSLFGTYASILSIGLQMDINLFFNYTPFQIVDSFKRYWEKDKYDFYRKVSTTPMMDVSKMEEPDEWTRNLYPIAQ